MHSLPHRQQRLARTENALRFAASLVDSVETSNSFDRSLLIHAFASVDRSHFIEPAFFPRAYEDVSLPIGFGQTISKPSTVARMLANLNLRSGDKVLEIGAGSAYVSALLAAMNLRVYATEIVPRLARLARRRLDQLGLQTVLLKCGDGMKGWSSEAPFDAILVSAACSSLPTELIRQLKFGGRLVAPMKFLTHGSPANSQLQRLYLWQRNDVEVVEESLQSAHDLGPCSFVAVTA